MTSWQKQTAAELRQQLTEMGHRRLPTNRDGFDDEFDALRAVDHKVRSNRDEYYTATLGSNMSKNRFRDVLPNEGTRVILDPINARGDGDYINANYIDGRRLFGVPFVYIATQAPLASTLNDFWRMIYENNTAFIVMLCAEIESGKVKSERYWPDAVGEVLPVGAMNIVLVNENHRHDSVFRTIALRTLEGRERTIHHLQFIRWPDQGIPDSSAGLIEMVYSLGRTPLSTQTPIVVHCSGGVGRTGVFITMHIALALFQLEQPISIPRIVQYLKYCRTGTIQRKDQYLFTYYAILREMEKMVWAAETAKVTTTRLPGQNSRRVESYNDISRRPMEYTPRHPAQSAPEIGPKSVISHTEAQSHIAHSGRSHLGSLNAPEHSIRAMADVVAPTRANAESAVDELEAMRRRNQLFRSTPARLQPSDRQPSVASPTRLPVNQSLHLEPLTHGGNGGGGGTGRTESSYNQGQFNSDSNANNWYDSATYSRPNVATTAPPITATTTTTTTYSPIRTTNPSPPPAPPAASSTYPPANNNSMSTAGGGAGTLSARLMEQNNAANAAASASYQYGPMTGSKTAPELGASTPAPSQPAATSGTAYPQVSSSSSRPMPNQGQGPQSGYKGYEDISPIASTDAFGSPSGPRTKAGANGDGWPIRPIATGTTATPPAAEVNPRPADSAPTPTGDYSTRPDRRSQGTVQSDLTSGAEAFHSDVFGSRANSGPNLGRNDAAGFTSAGSRGNLRRADFGLL